MKLAHEHDGARLRVSMSGDLEAASCDCVRNFWELRVAGHDDVHVDLSDVETGDGHAIAVLTTLLRDSLAAGSRLTLHAPPQMLAHTLYQSGMLRHPGLVLEQPRQEEPYAG